MCHVPGYIRVFATQPSSKGARSLCIWYGRPRSPFIPESSPYDSRFDKYSTHVTLYKYRSLSKHSDATNGFSAILQVLEQSEYSEGFFWALPIADLNWALL